MSPEDRARQFNALQANTLPGELGIVWEAAEPGRAAANHQLSRQVTLDGRAVTQLVAHQ